MSKGDVLAVEMDEFGIVMFEWIVRVSRWMRWMVVCMRG